MLVRSRSDNFSGSGIFEVSSVWNATDLLLKFNRLIYKSIWKKSSWIPGRGRILGYNRLSAKQNNAALMQQRLVSSKKIPRDNCGGWGDFWRIAKAVVMRWLQPFYLVVDCPRFRRLKLRLRSSVSGQLRSRFVAWRVENRLKFNRLIPI